MKRIASLLGFTFAFGLAMLLAPATAEAATVRVKVKAEVAAPFLVVKPPRPIIRPSRITLRLHRPGVTHVRLFGHHHHGHVIRVGHHAPHFKVRAKLKPHKVHVHGPHLGGPKVHISGPKVHVGGPKVHIGGPKGKFKAKGKFKF